MKLGKRTAEKYSLKNTIATRLMRWSLGIHAAVNFQQDRIHEDIGGGSARARKMSVATTRDSFSIG